MASARTRPSPPSMVTARPRAKAAMARKARWSSSDLKQGVTRLDVVNFISHGIRKDQAEPAKHGDGTAEGEGGDGKESPLEQFRSEAGRDPAGRGQFHQPWHPQGPGRARQAW